VRDVAAPRVVIVAGGLGTRVRHLAGDLPKSLLPVNGEPFVHHQLRLLRHQGVREVVLVTGYRGAQIEDAVGDGAAFGLSVSYVDEGEELHGTAGALRVALDAGSLPGWFAVLYGDSYLPIDLAPVWAAFADARQPALMTVLRNEDRWDRSNVVLEHGKVTLYDKRPEARDPRMAWIDFGLGVLERRVVEAVSPAAVVDLADVYRELSARGELAGLEVASRFYEVGSPDGVADLEEYLARAP
jgi:NDP-sugar pyrophosphorylase family protein